LEKPVQLSQLEYLQAVANYGGVRKAARAVHVSPQAVSSAIKKLESECSALDGVSTKANNLAAKLEALFE